MGRNDDVTGAERDVLDARPLERDTAGEVRKCGNDGVVDQDDLAVFKACSTGPGIPYDPNHLPAGCTLAPK